MSKFKEYLEAAKGPATYNISVGQDWGKKLVDYVKGRKGWEIGRGGRDSSSTGFNLKITTADSVSKIKNELWNNLSHSIYIGVKAVNEEAYASSLNEEAFKDMSPEDKAEAVYDKLMKKEGEHSSEVGEMIDAVIEENPDWDIDSIIGEIENF